MTTSQLRLDIIILVSPHGLLQKFTLIFITPPHHPPRPPNPSTPTKSIRNRTPAHPSYSRLIHSVSRIRLRIDHRAESSRVSGSNRTRHQLSEPPSCSDRAREREVREWKRNTVRVSDRLNRRTDRRTPDQATKYSSPPNLGHHQLICTSRVQNTHNFASPEIDSHTSVTQSTQ